MQNILINLKNKSKLHFLLELLSKYDFIEILKPASHKTSGNSNSFLKTAGLWKNRNIDAEKFVRELRKGKRLDD